MAASWKKIRSNISPRKFQSYLLDPHAAWVVMIALFIAEVVVNVLVIHKIPYTEIDWKAYMQEVEGVVNGTYDYTKLKGDTGPLVYPAGFVYIFTALYFLTGHGLNIRLAQYIFSAFYLLTLVLVFNIYRKTRKVPPYVMFFMCCASYRIHSIYILRLFNDPVAMIFLYAAINCFLDSQWHLGCVLYSFAVSVKMNILLFAPALLVLLLVSQGIPKTLLNLGICGVIQVIVGLPFLLANPWGYCIKAFDLGRQFMYKWTVNWRFLPIDIFLNRYFHITLLALHVLFLVIFFIYKWGKLFGCARNVATGCWNPINRNIKPNDLVLPLFTANFIGVAFSRSLHYQFYVWYFHTLPYLLWSTPFPVIIRLLLLGVIELCWNTYPSTVYSSGALHASHAAILAALLVASPHFTPEDGKSSPRRLKKD